MTTETIFELKSPYRTDLKVTGYTFGTGSKSACIIGALRGNEVQQLYVCSQLIRVLKNLEKKGGIGKHHQILVIPSVNQYAMNVGKRFWAIDNSDINRMFPGDAQGETTQRVAAGLLERVRGYSYGIQFASFYMPGDFIPHVRMMDTGYQNSSLATLFGLEYVVVRKPKPYDMATLNYNWQLKNTHAFSIYTNETDKIDEKSALEAVAAVLRFLSRMGIIKFDVRSGYLSSIFKEEELHTVKTPAAGIFRRLQKPGSQVKYGEPLAEVLHPYEGDVIATILSPIDGIVFFSHNAPLTMENQVVFKLMGNTYI